MKTVLRGPADPEMTDRGNSQKGAPNSRSDVSAGYVHLSVDDLSAISSDGPSAPLSVVARDAQREPSVPERSSAEGQERSKISPSIVSQMPAPIFKRPVFFVGAAAIALAVALTGAMFLRAGQRKASPVVTSPDVLRRVGLAPLPTPPPASTSAPAPTSTEPVLAGAKPAAPVVPQPTEDSPKPSTDRKRPTHHRRPRPSVDENGIGIPPD